LLKFKKIPHLENEPVSVTYKYLDQLVGLFNFNDTKSCHSENKTQNVYSRV
jgi:hypothetical protein